MVHDVVVKAFLVEEYVMFLVTVLAEGSEGQTRSYFMVLL